jgi:anti-sigma factor RsiW
MNFSSQHISFAKLADLAEKRAPADEQAQAQAHLATCSRCTAEFERVAQVMELMKTDLATDAPRDVLANTMSLFGQRAAAREPSLLGRIVAALSFDSNMNLAPAFGVRSGQSAVRQLLYSAGENDIDLRVKSENEKWIVTGQVLGRTCSGGRVEIEGENGSAAASLNELCEFILPAVPAGSYTLRFQQPDAELEIPELELRS